MPTIPFLDYLIDLKQFESIELNKIHNFLNKYDQKKTWKFLFKFFEYFGERLKIIRVIMNKNRAQICSKN